MGTGGKSHIAALEEKPARLVTAAPEHRNSMPVFGPTGPGHLVRRAGNSGFLALLQAGIENQERDTPAIFAELIWSWSRTSLSPSCHRKPRRDWDSLEEVFAV